MICTEECEEIFLECFVGCGSDMNCVSDRPPQARHEFVPTPCRTQSCPDTSGRGTSKILFGRTRDRTGHNLFWEFGHDKTRGRVRHKFVSGRVQGTTRVRARPNLVQKRLRIWPYPRVIGNLEK